MDRERFMALAPVGFAPTDEDMEHGSEWALVVPGSIEVAPGFRLHGYEMVWSMTMSSN
jgi:hypothetical protein